MAAFCAEVLKEKTAVTGVGADLKTLKAGKRPSARAVRASQVAATAIKKIAAVAPTAIKTPLSVLSGLYSRLAVALKSGSISRIDTSLLAFNKTSVITEITKVGTYETQHCKLG